MPELTFPMTPPAAVLSRAREGDLDAFEQLVRDHERAVLGMALRLTGCREDAQEAAQEAFLRLYRNLTKIRHEHEVRPWLYRVTINVCHDMRRRRRPASSLEGFDIASSAADPELTLFQAQREQLVAKGLETLPEKERAAVLLRDVEGLSTREVAVILGSSETTVRSQICVARMKLKKFTDRYLRKKS